MIVTVAKGAYEYYVCRGRQLRFCDPPYLPIDKLEQAVIDHYVTVTFSNKFKAAVGGQFDKELAANLNNTPTT